MNTNGTDIVSATAGTAISAMEGVFVIASENDEKLTFSTTAPSKGKSIVINLNRATRGGVSTDSTTATIDRAIVRFDEGGQLPKFQLNPRSARLYITQGNDDYAVVLGEGNGELPVNFKAEHNGTYTLSVETENIEMSYFHLIDNMTGPTSTSWKTRTIRLRPRRATMPRDSNSCSFVRTQTTTMRRSPTSAMATSSSTTWATPRCK